MTSQLLNLSVLTIVLLAVQLDTSFGWGKLPDRGCRANSCQNGGTCHNNEGNSHYCECASGWRGTTCDEEGCPPGWRDSENFFGITTGTCNERYLAYGVWGSWSSWSCESESEGVTCGMGIRKRIRTCHDNIYGEGVGCWDYAADQENRSEAEVPAGEVNVELGGRCDLREPCSIDVCQANSRCTGRGDKFCLHFFPSNPQHGEVVCGQECVDLAHCMWLSTGARVVENPYSSNVCDMDEPCQLPTFARPRHQPRY